MAILIHCGEWGGAVSRCLFPLVTCLALAVSLSVAADAKDYTVSIPANGHSRSFQTKERQP